jgi:hypothetical protein
VEIYLCPIKITRIITHQLGMIGLTSGELTRIHTVSFGKSQLIRRRSTAMSNQTNLLTYFRSTYLGLKMGLISELPVNQRNAYKITESHINDPYKLAKAINDSDYEDDHVGNGGNE